MAQREEADLHNCEVILDRSQNGRAPGKIESRWRGTAGSAGSRPYDNPSPR